MELHRIPLWERHELPTDRYFTYDYGLLKKIWKETEGIRTLADFEAYIERAFTDPVLRQLFFGAIAYAKEDKTLPGRRLDWPKVREHQALNLGRRLRPASRLDRNDAILGLQTWIQGPGKDIGIKWRTGAGITTIRNPHALALDILSLVHSHLNHERPLPVEAVRRVAR